MNSSERRLKWASAALKLTTCLFLILAVSMSAGADEKRIYTDGELETMPAPGPNPYLSFLPADAEVDWRYWQAKMDYEARKRGEKMRVERELAGFAPYTKLIGVTDTEANNTPPTAQAISGFGTGMGDDNEADITGSIAAPATPTPFSVGAEDNGDIGSATATGVTSGTARTAMGAIGDGPHGSGGSGSADFDFFSISGVMAGDLITVDVDTADPTGDLDPNSAVWDSAGNLVAFNEDIGFGDFDSNLSYTADASGTYYVSVGGWKTGGQAAVLPGDPFDSSSGTGAASEGDYTLTIGLNASDADCYSVDLEPGDILGVDATGTATLVQIFSPSNELLMGSGGSGANLYPPTSPLPGGSVTADQVTFVSGDHVVCIQGDVGAYAAELRVFRNNLETAGETQILFVDFDGATVDPSIWGGPAGSATLSPLSSFLAGWGLAPGDEDAVIDAILASMEESITQDLAMASNPSFSVEILNSRDHADPFGDPNVSRLIVGGTIAELGISTIGIAQFIDPGNFGTEDSAVTLLDLLSAPSTDPNSLNQFGLGGGATQIELVGEGVGNITAHEAGHYLGNWHTENSSALASIMDQGGDLANSVGVGPDNTFGTADDVDVDFGPDTFAVSEGFVGTEYTDEKTAFALPGGALFTDGFESGDFSAWVAVGAN